jgi:GntR family transcriptional regulator/MocR family aminotransferase
MSLPIALARHDHLSLQEQIYRSIRDNVLSGTYATGVRLPSTRDLALALRVSRTTVLLAYEWLTSEGYIETHKGVGTFVCQVIDDTVRAGEANRSAAENRQRPAAAPRPSIVVPRETPILVNKDSKRAPIDFWYGRPDPRQFPLKAWRRLITQQLSAPNHGLADYCGQAGDPKLRAAISEHISTTRGFLAGPNRIVITSGAQEALNIVSRLLIREATTVAIENPGYGSAAALFRSYAARLAPVPVDRDGLIVDTLSGIDAKLVYTTPSHQFPTGVVLTLERRQALLAWAESANAYVIEDDYDSEIIYDRPPIAALAALDQHERVIYVGSFSKTIGAGLRIGFLALPSELVSAAVAIKSMTSYGQSWLEQSTLAAFIGEGSFRTHLRRIRTLYRTRRDTLIAALRRVSGPDVAISGEDSGLHLVWTVPEHFPTADALAAAAEKLGVGLYTPAKAGAVEMGAVQGPERRLLMGYSALTSTEIEVAIKKIALAAGLVEHSAGRDSLVPGGRIEPHAGGSGRYPPASLTYGLGSLTKRARRPAV